MNISLQIPPITPLDEEEPVAAPEPTTQLEAESTTCTDEAEKRLVVGGWHQEMPHTLQRKRRNL